MGLYNVVTPCFVAGRHYVRPTSQPIQVDDTEAAKLVEAGSLTPYGAPEPSAESVPPTPPVDPADESAVGTAEEAPESESKPRSRKRTED